MHFFASSRDLAGASPGHSIMNFNDQNQHVVGGAFMPAAPIYRPLDGIDGPLADYELSQPGSVMSC